MFDAARREGVSIRHVALHGDQIFFAWFRRGGDVRGGDALECHAHTPTLLAVLGCQRVERRVRSVAPLTAEVSHDGIHVLHAVAMLSTSRNIKKSGLFLAHRSMVHLDFDLAFQRELCGELVAFFQRVHVLHHLIHVFFFGFGGVSRLQRGRGDVTE